MYICIYVYICVYIYREISMSIYIHLCLSLYICILTSTCIRVIYIEPLRPRRGARWSRKVPHMNESRFKGESLSL